MRPGSVTARVQYPVPSLPSWWGSVPKPLGPCPVCGQEVTALAGSPWRRPHLLTCTPCLCWVTEAEANDLENGAWQ